VVLGGNEPAVTRRRSGMNKRSALMLSAALVLTLIVGGFAVATGLTGPTVSNAVPRAERRASSEPVVRTVRRTVKVHKKADAKPGEVVTVAAPAAAAASPSSSNDLSGDDDSYEDDDAHEDEGDDHGDEGGDHGDHEDEGAHEDESDDD
jgi:hypothetical protein